MYPGAPVKAYLSSNKGQDTTISSHFSGCPPKLSLGTEEESLTLLNIVAVLRAGFIDWVEDILFIGLF